MGIRFIFFILALLLIGWIVRFLLSNRKPPARRPQQAKVTGMKQCAYCGVHVPADEALFDDEVSFCSTAHRQDWLSQQKDSSH